METYTTHVEVNINIQKAVLVVLVGVATGALAFGVACGSSDEPPDQDSRSQDDRRAERSEQPTKSISDGSPSSQASSGSGSSVDPTVSSTNPFEATVAIPAVATPAVATPAVATPTLEIVPILATTPTPTPVLTPNLVPTAIPTPVTVPTAIPFSGPPLHRAVFEGNPEKVEKWLTLGEDVNAMDNNGKTPLYVAVEQDNPDIAGLLLTWEAHLAAPEGWDLLHVASATGSAEMVELLLDRGADIEAYGYEYWKPLYEALEQNYPKVEEQMGKGIVRIERIKSTVTPGGRSSSLPPRGEAAPSGWRALHVAVAAGNIEVTELLLNRGADIEARNTVIWAPLHIAVAAEDGMDLAELLLDWDADIEAKTGYRGSKGTPLHIATEQNKPEIATMLLDRGADAKAQDIHGNTVCQVARNLNRFTLTRLLGRLCRP